MTEENNIDKVCRYVVNHINNNDVSRDEIEGVKMDACSKYNPSRVPKNSEIIKYSDNDEVRNLLKKSPIRSSSGVVPVAIMTHPVSVCPHGRCLFCPAGPDSKFDQTQLSYPGGPSVRRAKRNNYDPYKQTMDRLTTLYENGHDVDKVDLIIKSATYTSRSHDYQRWFVKRSLEAMNDFSRREENRNDAELGKSPKFKYLESVIKENETSECRCIGITIETKPDWCDVNQIDRMLEMGVTKVELGVQTVFDEINNKMNRGHGIEESIEANKNLRDSGMKVGFHMMPGLPGTDMEMNLKDFDEIFENPSLRPDYLKIYPTLVVEGTVVYDMWEEGDYSPLSTEEAIELVSNVKEKMPKYVRLERVQRDIPANQIVAGVQKSNLRQLARKEMDGSCDCIRCREVGLNNESVRSSNIEFNILSYDVCGGTEKFLSYEDSSTNQIIGFLRLRFPDTPHRIKLENSSIVRELHVYGNQVPISSKGEWQHKGYGKKLMKEAEELSKENGFNKISVISGIGVREYYKKKMDYNMDGPYVSKNL